MAEQREESEFVGDCKEPMEEAGLFSKTQTLGGEDANTVEVSDSGVCDVGEADGSLKAGAGNAPDLVSDENQVKSDVGSVEDMAENEDNVEESGEVETEENVETIVSSDDVEGTDAITELETERDDMDGDDGTVEVEPVDETEGSDLRKDVQRVSETARNGATHETAGEEETVSAAGNEVTAEKETFEVEENGGAEDKADQEKESAGKTEEDDNKMVVDSKQGNEENGGLIEQRNPGSETKDAIHSESAQVPEEPGTGSEVSSAAETCREDEMANVNQNEENGEAMVIDDAAEIQVEKDNAGNESAGEADRNDSNAAKKMEIDEQKDITDVATDLTRTVESAVSANPNNPSEDAATGEVEPMDQNALFDPSSDITTFIDFSGVSSWSGNIQDLKTDTGNVSLKEDKKATGMAEGVATVETVKSVDATVNAESLDKVSVISKGNGSESNDARVATVCSKDASDAIMEPDENQEEKDHEGLDQKAVDQQDTMKVEDGIAHEAPSIEPNQKEDTEMEENPYNSDYGDVGTGSDTKTNGVKRKADVLSEEDSPEEGRKTVSLAKVSFAQRPSFKIGACIARAASQMAGSTSVLKGSNIGAETLSVESFVSQLHCAATDPVKENVVSEIAAGFFLDFRNSSASQQVAPEKVGGKRGRPSNSNAGGTEAFEFEEMGDTYWTDRVIHNGGEEQTPPTEKGNYKVVPVELKPAQVKRTRRPYKRRQSQISVPLPSASDKPANFDENAPAELIMKFSETDTIPPEKSLSKMFRHFGPIKESQTEVDKENNRARVVFRKSADAEVAYNSAGRFSIFGTKAVNYELNFTITEAFKVQPYVVSLGEEDAALSLPS